MNSVIIRESAKLKSLLKSSRAAVVVAIVAGLVWLVLPGTLFSGIGWRVKEAPVEVVQYFATPESLEVGSTATVSMEFMFTEVPTTSLDPVWQATIVVSCPTVGRWIFNSKLCAIKPQEAESYSIHFVPKAAGLYTVEAYVAACTHAGTQSEESSVGKYFEYNKSLAPLVVYAIDSTTNANRAIDLDFPQIRVVSPETLPKSQLRIETDNLRTEGQSETDSSPSPLRFPQVYKDHIRINPNRIPDSTIIARFKNVSAATYELKIASKADIDSVTVVPPRCADVSEPERNLLRIQVNDCPDSSLIWLHMQNKSYRVLIASRASSFLVSGIFEFVDNNSLLKPASFVHCATLADEGFGL